jgi:hypothetical protein
MLAGDSATKCRDATDFDTPEPVPLDCTFPTRQRQFFAGEPAHPQSLDPYLAAVESPLASRPRSSKGWTKC